MTELHENDDATLKVSTTAIGDALRDHVIALLEAEGHKVSREVRVGAKRVDILLEIDEEFKPQTIAVECKNLSKSMSQGELNSIFADYLSLLEQGQVTGVFVVTRLDFSPEAKLYVNTKRGRMDVFTITEFEESLLGFRKYCRNVRDLFSEGGLEDYYIKSSTEGGAGLHDQIVDWIASPTTKPVAILGGYGMGKTSYCKFLTRELADRYLDDPSCRVPIYIRLSDIATQTDVDGLIAKTLADRYSTKNYSFAKFKKLNRAGKFVLIFDGFDEMKHALSWADFKYNFSQIHSLLDGKAKILVAGRPNAFLSDDEHAWILRGQRVSGDHVIKMPDAPEYHELSIAPFTEGEITSFLKMYLGRRPPIDLTTKDAIEDWISSRLKDFDQIKESGDLHRPVHLKIYADIAADPSAQLENFSTYGLYEIATTAISEREGEKVVRKQIDAVKRQTVVERIAWWLWDTYDGRVLYFVPDVVPESIIGRDLLDDPNYERDALYREIFTGSFLERKYGQNYYFSHRSFLEFFVARRLEKAEKLSLPVHSIFKNLNPEILAFLRQGPNFTEFMSYVDKGMQRFSGDIPLPILEEVFLFRQAKGLADVQLPIQVLLRYYGYLRASEIDISALVKMMGTDVASKNQDERETAIFFALFVLRARFDRDVLLGLLKALAKTIVWPRQAGTSSGRNIPKYNYSRQNIGEYVFVKFARIAAERSRDGNPIVSFDYARAFEEIKDKRSPKITINTSNFLMSPEANPPARFDFSEVFEGIGSQEQRAALDVLTVGVA